MLVNLITYICLFLYFKDEDIASDVPVDFSEYLMPVLRDAVGSGVESTLEDLDENAGESSDIIEKLKSVAQKYMQEDILDEAKDINDPALIRARAARSKAAKMKAAQPKKSVNPNYKAVKNATKIKARLKKKTSRY